MRVLILVIFLLSCKVSGQRANDEFRQEQDFKQLLEDSKKSQEEAVKAAEEADKQTTQIVNKAASTISALKAEVKLLKQELYETKKALDSVESNDNIQPFKLSPISGG